MVRILHVFGRMDMGGAESRIMDLYRNIDRNKVQFDFVEHTTDKCFYDDEIERLGGRIFRVPRFKIANISEYRSAFKKLFLEHMQGKESEFAMVQGHITSSAAIYLPIAKKYGVKVTIAHARSAGVDPGIKGYLTRVMRSNLANKADYLFTCSRLAGISVFGQKAVDAGRTTFIPNAIDCRKFAFDSEVRDRIRRELKIEDSFVIGHVGRFHYAKNHEYLLEVMQDIVKRWDGYEKFSNISDLPLRPVLILLGEGPRMDEMKNLAKELGIEQNVKFLNNKSDVYNYYQAMDIFVYPSRYEGLPGTVVEAQCSGLPIYMSDTICDEVIVSDLVSCLPITVVTEEWGTAVMDKAVNILTDSSKRNDYLDKIIDSGFDVKEQAKFLEEFYLTGSMKN